MDHMRTVVLTGVDSYVERTLHSMTIGHANSKIDFRIRGGHQVRLVRSERGLLSMVDDESTEVLIYDATEDEDGRRFLHFAQRIGRMPQYSRPIHPARMIPVFSKQPSVSSLLALGRLGIRTVAHDPSDLSSILEEMASYLAPSKSVLCLAGGGMDGLMYELGVLLAMEEVLGPQALLSFDEYYGISAGAILATLLAAGLTPSMLARAFYGNAGPLPHIPDYLPFDTNLTGLARRILSMTARTSALSHSPRAFLEWVSSVIPPGVFRGNRIEEYVHSVLGNHGPGDSFDALPGRLYVGVTDQDTGEHILLGMPGYDSMPVSQAVHASMALVPLFAPQFMGGRWLVDGSITRTTEAEPALERGASLLVIADPLVPVRGDPGFVQSRGGVYEFIQMFKSLIHTRSLEELPHLMDAYPFTEFLLFEPEENSMLPMSGSPLRYGFRVDIIPSAKDSALRRMRRHWKRLKRTFETHGLTPIKEP